MFMQQVSIKYLLYTGFTLMVKQTHYYSKGF